VHNLNVCVPDTYSIAELTPSLLCPVCVDRGEVAPGESASMASLFPRDVFMSRLEDFQTDKVSSFPLHRLLLLVLHKLASRVILYVHLDRCGSCV
jgi:hypothetical protein